MDQIMICVYVPLAAAVGARSSRYGAGAVSLTDATLARLSPAALMLLSDGREDLGSVRAGALKLRDGESGHDSLTVPNASEDAVVAALEAAGERHAAWLAAEAKKKARRVVDNAAAAELLAVPPHAATSADVTKAQELTLGHLCDRDGDVMRWLGEAAALAKLRESLKAAEASWLNVDPRSPDAEAVNFCLGDRYHDGRRYFSPGDPGHPALGVELASQWDALQRWTRAREAARAERKERALAEAEAREAAAVARYGKPSQIARYDAGLLPTDELLAIFDLERTAERGRLLPEAWETDEQIAARFPDALWVPYSTRVAVGCDRLRLFDRLTVHDVVSEHDEDEDHAHEPTQEGRFHAAPHEGPVTDAQWRTLAAVRVAHPEATVTLLRHVGECDRKDCKVKVIRFGVRAVREGAKREYGILS